VFPGQVKEYLFDAEGHVRPEVYDVTPLRTVVSKHVADLATYVSGAFNQGWPEADADVVAPELLSAQVEAIPDRLEERLAALRSRLRWALDQMARLDRVRSLKGTLDPDEDALRARCDRLVKRLKGQSQRQRRDAEGFDDTNTYGMLAAEGFLPGYGLEIGSVLGTAQVPRQIGRGEDLSLPRPPAVALREYVPGNIIYANGNRYTPRYYHLEPEAPLTFVVDVASEAVQEAGTAPAAGEGGVAALAVGLGATTLRAVPMCDVDLTHLSHIGDEEENRFQLPVATYGQEQGRHGGGRHYTWGPRTVLLRRNVHMRLMNVGPTTKVGRGELGYPVCTVCGQSRSPLSSPRERQHFEQDHLTRCGSRVEPTGFFADVVADAIALRGCGNREEAYSVLEVLLAGAASVLEMDREDLLVLAVGSPGQSEVDGLLYDPMPGGSGLLDQICQRWPEVLEAGRRVATECPAACARICVECLMTFRNAHYHRHLNRQIAAQRLQEWGSGLVFVNDLPPVLPVEPPTGGHEPTNDWEVRFRMRIRRAGFPEPTWNHQIQLGHPLGSTTPDCLFPGDDDDDPGVAVYVDGLSGRIHGNPETRARDRQIREELRARRYEVFEIAATDLEDRGAMARHFYRLGRILVGKDEAKTIRDRTEWFEET
jgi:hypothetical protein